MASQSKEENILKLILENSPLKEWHFNEIIKEAKVTKVVANKWLKKYQKEDLLKKIKIKGHFPYFIVGKNNPVYYSYKKFYALEKLYKSNIISNLLSQKAKTIIFFGSFIKGDWYKDSDIDIFVYGDIVINKNVYEEKLKRNIEMHIFKNKKEIQEVKSGLLNNIINGYIIKGQIQDFIKIT